MSKIELAKALYAQNASKSRKEIIELFVTELGLTPAAASTYQNTCKKAYQPAVVEQVKIGQVVATTALKTKVVAQDSTERFAELDSSIHSSIEEQSDEEKAYWAEYFAKAVQ